MAVNDDRHDSAHSDDELTAPSDLFRLAERAAGAGAFRLDLETDRWEWTPQMAALFGFDRDATDLTSTDWERAIFIDDVPKVRTATKVATETGVFLVEFRVRHSDDSVHWLAGKGEAGPEAGARARWVRGAFFDITDRKELEARLLALNETLEARIAELREEGRVLEILNRTGIAVAAELDLERLVQSVTDAGVELTGAAFGAFFDNVINDQGKAYTLSTLSGVTREAFAQFPMPRNTAIFEPTSRGLGPVRSDDILRDPRYGPTAPYHGMPKGRLPVRSYLALPVVSRSGEVLGCLFFGHPDPGVFDERDERILMGLAAQAAVAIDNARLYQTSRREVEARAKAEDDLKALNATLESRVAERARELETSFRRLHESDRRFRMLVEAVTDYAIYMLGPEGNVVGWNPGAERVKGYTADEIIGQNFSRFYTAEDRQNGLPQQVLATASSTGKYEAEGWRVRKDGTTFWASVVVQAIRDPSGELVGFAKVTRDLTERRAAEEQLRQSQKMEAIGQLTGGIAHDFNNMLTVITGNIEMLQRRLSEGSDTNLHRFATAALHGSSRAATLTHRLLAFARRQPLDPKPLLVNTLIAGMSEMLQRTLGETIQIETVLAGGLWTTFADPNQLENCLLNLAINARDAMPEGGKLTIEVANVFLDEEYAAAAELSPGQYVGIFVSDTGTGMTPDVLSKAFDPFFTTKDVGQGTGLGLSQVYGFIKQSGGHVKIYSEVGAGTSIKLYLPRHYAGEGIGEKQAGQVDIPRAQGETILVVEDDPDVRAYAIEMLRELGYAVIEAPDGAAGLRLLDAHRKIVLLLTDVGLPGGMNGRQVADEARRRRPGLKILFMSGYARNAIVHHGRLDPGVELITKPFTYAGLALRIRHVLDAK